MRIAFVAAVAMLSLTGGARAGEYMFSLSWEPTFCAAGHQDKTECRAMKQDSYDASHLVLHGLWPQGGQYCGVSQDIVALDQNNQTWPQMPPVQVSDATRARMDKTFPGVASYLDRHEWYKHGTCSGLSPDGYFNLALDLVDQANAMNFGRFITSNVGGTVAVDDLCGKLTLDFGSAFQKAATVKQSNGALGEVRFALRDGAQPLALDSGHLSPGRKAMSCGGQITIRAIGRTGS